LKFATQTESKDLRHHCGK